MAAKIRREPELINQADMLLRLRSDATTPSRFRSAAIATWAIIAILVVGIVIRGVVSPRGHPALTVEEAGAVRNAVVNGLAAVMTRLPGGRARDLLGSNLDAIARDAADADSADLELLTTRARRALENLEQNAPVAYGDVATISATLDRIDALNSPHPRSGTAR